MEQTIEYKIVHIRSCS